MMSDSVKKLLMYISISLIFLDYSNGIFELIPTGKLLVCPGQNQLEVICSSGESSFLEWNLTFPVFGEPLLTDTRVIASTNAVGRVNGLQVERVLFTFNIISISPLASRLSWNETTPILNGSSIMCTERDTGMDRKSELILDVVNTTTAYPPFPVVQIHSEQFGMNNVTVILEWTTEGGGMSYNASVVPESPSAVLLAGNTGIKLVLLYNTQYNLSTAATLCERNSATTITQLSYVSCGKPVVSPNVGLDYNSTLLGSQLLLWCEDVDGIIITAQCSEDATWVPDPNEVVCSVSSTFFTIDSESSTLGSPVESDSMVETNWMLIGICIAVGVLFGVMCVVLTAVVLVIIVRKGFGCRQTEIITEVEHQEKDINMSMNIIYEHVKYSKQKIALQENVAYCTTGDCVSTIHA